MKRIPPRLTWLLLLSASAVSSHAEPPANDLFENRPRVTGAPPLELTGNFAEATVSPDDPVFSFWLKKSLWWELPPQPHEMLALRRPVGVRAGLGVYYRDDENGPLRPLAETGSAKGFPETLYVQPWGTLYLMAGESGAAPEGGDFSLRIEPLTETPHVQNLGTAVPVEVDEVNFDDNLRYWDWTAPRAGVFVLDTLAGLRKSGGSQGSAFHVLNGGFLYGDGFNLSSRGRWYFRAEAAGNTLNFGIEAVEPAFEIREVLPPANDAFAAAEDLGSLESAEFGGEMILATAEPGEERWTGSPMAYFGTRWWKWRAPVDGIYRFTASSEVPGWPAGTGETTLRSTQPRCFVFPEAPLNQLTWPPPSLIPGPPEAVPAQVIRARAGDEFRIAVSDLLPLSGQAVPPVKVTLERLPDFSNDDLAGAAEIPGTLTEPLRVSFHTYTASRQAREPEITWPVNPFPEQEEAFRSLWWRWRAPADGALLVSEVVKDRYSLFPDVFENGGSGDPAALRPAPRSMDNGYGCKVTAGTDYWIRAAALEREPGDAARTLRWQPLPAPPANDDFVQARPVEALPFTTSQNFLVSTPESGEPAHDGQSASRSIWWKWTAPRDQLVALQQLYEPLAGGALLRLAVDNGDTLTTLTPVELHRERQFVPFYFQAVAGTTYHIVADASLLIHPIAWEMKTLPVSTSPPTPNDAFAFAQRLSSGFQTIEAAHKSYKEDGVAFAGLETGEPVPALPGGAAASTWWRWPTPPQPEWFAIEALSSGMTATVYTGMSVDQLAPVPTVKFPWSEAFYVQTRPGTDYSLQIVSTGLVERAPFRFRAASAYENWALKHPALPPDQSGPENNPSGDGISNLLKLAFGLDPLKNSGSSGDDPARGNMPSLTVNKNLLTLTWRQDDAALADSADEWQRVKVRPRHYNLFTIPAGSYFLDSTLLPDGRRAADLLIQPPASHWLSLEVVPKGLF